MRNSATTSVHFSRPIYVGRVRGVEFTWESRRPSGSAASTGRSSRQAQIPCLGKQRGLRRWARRPPATGRDAGESTILRVRRRLNLSVQEAVRIGFSPIGLRIADVASAGGCGIGRSGGEFLLTGQSAVGERRFARRPGCPRQRRLGTHHDSSLSGTGLAQIMLIANRGRPHQRAWWTGEVR